ncbi:MAG: lipoprotein signal peptidase [Bacteroidales bacterium]
MSKVRTNNGWLCIAVIFAVLFTDQIVKILIKTNMFLGEDIEITPWFHILFVENNGMAFGIEVISKLFLSLFRVIAVTFIGYYLYKLIKKGKDVKRGYITCIALILAGAFGNIIDSLFYGIIFNDPMPPEVANIFPDGGGYATILHGRVVDMLYFPLFSFNWPEWVPEIGGEQFLFFRPIFNIADSAITLGVLGILLFYRKSLSNENSSNKPAQCEEESL